jgi:hypothetical protein
MVCSARHHAAGGAQCQTGGSEAASIGLSVPGEEEVGWVSLVGSHPALAPLDDRGRPVALTDPLQVTGGWDLEPILEAWESASPEDREPISWEISADAESKGG